MSQALVDARPQAVATRSERPLVMAEALKQEAEQRQLLGQYVRDQMKPGEDYGAVVEGGKPGLLKPGAEKLTSLFRCVPQFKEVEIVRDHAKPFYYFEFKCELVSIDTGQVVAEGFGSANSRESKWRYRNADRTCPNCGKATIKKSKNAPRDNPDAVPGWYCWSKIGGCGAQFEANDADITSQVAGKIENPDVADSANTVLKIAKKRSHVDAALGLARCSDLFSQDTEDDENAAPSATSNKGDTEAVRGRAIQEGRLQGMIAGLSITEGKNWPTLVGEVCKSVNVQSIEAMPTAVLRAVTDSLKNRFRKPAAAPVPAAAPTPTQAVDTPPATADRPDPRSEITPAREIADHAGVTEEEVVPF